MNGESPPPSARRTELLDAAYGYVLANGIGALSLRPLAAAVESSPRVLLYLFGSKDGLVRALLTRARGDELAMLDRLAATAPDRPVELAVIAETVWSWLVNPAHRALLVLWVEAYGRSLVEPTDPWAGFARATVEDWLHVLAESQPVARRDTPAGRAERTLVLAVLRGALLDLLATGDLDRAGSAVHQYLDLVRAARSAELPN